MGTVAMRLDADGVCGYLDLCLRPRLQSYRRAHRRFHTQRRLGTAGIGEQVRIMIVD